MHPLTGEFELSPLFDLGATLVWAMSGAAMGVRRGYDYSGIFVMAFVSAVGGGLLRDGIFLQQIPVAIRSGNYLIAVVIGAILGTIGTVVTRGRKPARAYQTFNDIVDALGLGAYACVGAQMTLQMGLSIPAAMLVGVVNGVGGALLRDVLVNRIWMLPGQILAIAAFAGVCFFIFLVEVAGVHASIAAWAAIAVTFTIRTLAIRYDWRTRPLITTPTEK
ncbi:MAG: TRIC cation channel family protein [Candidatus Eremiobacteraeota bacterium]|nr:TRIC cation channel family protein [Candidatus Eremiobacteraeota bacterium]